MEITVNGGAHQSPSGETVATLLKRIGFEGRPCAVEVNRAVVPRRDHASAELHEGDRIEIVTLVGGG